MYGNIYIKLALTNAKKSMHNRFGLRTSDFGLRTSDFGLRTSDFGLRTSDFGQVIAVLKN